MARRKPSESTSQRYFFLVHCVLPTHCIPKLEEKLATLQGDLARSRQEYDNQESERTRIRYLSSFKRSMYVISLLFYRRLETETNEKLADVYQRLLQAGVDRTESEREAKLKETLSSLQRIFPGE